MEHLVPAMIRAREQGKIRHIGVTEEFIPDTGHMMLSRALSDTGPWEVVMVGFNLLNPSARERVFARTMEKGVGTLIMFAVRRALSQTEKLAALLDDLEQRGLIESGALSPEDPLGFLIGQGGAESVPEAAYRFCRHEPGADVVLCGTGSIEHLEENARAINSPALPEHMLTRLRALFGKIDCVSGN
jgi:aryl-alcohol dehydrogenase-like predicted oxidoreductase